MLTDPSAAAFGALCDVIQGRAVNRFNDLALTTSNEMSRRNVVESSMHAQMLDRDAADVIGQYAQEMFDALMEAHAAEPVTDAITRTSHLQGLLADRLSGLGRDVTAARDDCLQSIRQQPPMPSEASETSRALDRAQTQYRAKVQLAVTTIANTAKAPPAVSVNVGGSVASIQTGAHATATVTQAMVTAPDTEAVKAALDALVEALRTAQHVTADQRDEVIEVLREVKTEVKKFKPNKSKLGALLSAAGTIIRTIPNAAPAWAQVKEWYAAVSTAAKGVLGG